MTNGTVTVCSLCEKPVDGTDHVINLVGEAAHVVCLEATGAWNAKPSKTNERKA